MVKEYPISLHYPLTRSISSRKEYAPEHSLRSQCFTPTDKPKVPNFFLTVKLHKSPYKFRNIANSGRGLFMYHKLVANFLRLLLNTIRLVAVEFC